MPKVFNLLALLPTLSSPQMAVLKQTAKLRYKIKYGTFPSDPATLQIQESFSIIQSLPLKKAFPQTKLNIFPSSSIMTSARNVLYDDSGFSPLLPLNLNSQTPP